MAKILSIDLETYSEVDLLKAGVYRYAEDPSFEILMLAWAIDDGPVSVIDLASGENAPEEILELLGDASVIKTAYNANFERTCLAAWTGIPQPADQWKDTMIVAAELGLPRSLADVGKVIGLPEDQQKMKEGKALIQYFSKPCRPTKANGQRTRNLPEHASDKWETFKAYCAQDVETERHIRKVLEKYTENEGEQELWVIDQKINDLGVGVDLVLAENAAEIDQKIKEDLQAQAREISGIENPGSVAQVKAWIKDQTGQEITTLEKKAMPEVLERLKEFPKVLRFLEVRKALSKTSMAKYTAMGASACRDGRIRGLTQFYGANRTGRWAGRLVQMQNLPQNKMPDEDLDIARELVRSGEIEAFELLYEPAQTLSELIRTAFIPRPGYKFIVSDFSAIEARVLAWLAGESWRLAEFNGRGKIYEASAEKMFHLPEGSVKKGDPMRTKGKIAELALGYGGSVGALKVMGALEMGLDEEELQPLVDTWRRSNRQITKFWWGTGTAAEQCIRTGSAVSIREGIRFRKEGPLMRLRLPSGRELSYVKPRVSFSGDITYEGVIQAGGWGRQETYGPKLVENIVQATARDCLAESIKRLDAEGIPVVFHVHDEVICEVPENSWTAEDVAEIMGQPIEWAEGLPMKADAYECSYYRKD